MAPKWQRARVLKALHPQSEVEVGHTIWVRIGSTCERWTINIYSRKRTLGRSHLTNLTTAEFPKIWKKVEMVELLARDENDFAEDVPLISVEDYHEQCRAH